MPLTIAAIRSGHDPVEKLPEGSFHRWLDEQLICPKCDATYNLVCDYNSSVSRFFEDESRRLILLLKKAIFLGHGNGHLVSHFETAGVVVRSYTHTTAPRTQPTRPASDRAS
jgi:hypothetical protein